jgi:uncharacterized protein YkwD
LLRFSCPHCRCVLQIAEHLAGSRIACGKCRQVLTIPAPVPPPTAIKPPPVPALPPRPAPPPTLPLRRRRSLATLGLWGIPVLLLLAVMGATYFLAGRLGRTSSAAPQTAKAAPVEKTAETPHPHEAAPAEKKEPAPDGKKEPATESDLADLTQKVIAAINTPRQAAGLSPVTLDATRSAGCRAHALYLLRNAAVLAEREASPHDEDRDLPGATAAGGQAARSAHIDEKPPLTTVAAWLKAPGHRDLLLSPQLRTIGLGVAHAAAGRWISVFDLHRADAEEPAGAVLYPADGQTEVPLAYAGVELPDPLPQTAEKTSGYPLTATFPPRTKVVRVSAHLEDEAGNAVPFWLSSPEQPANPQHPKVQQNSVCLLARQPLRPGMRYVVRLAAIVEDHPWQTTWSFTTRDWGETRRDLSADVLKRINARRQRAGLPTTKLDRPRSRACAAHAAYLFRNFARLAGSSFNDEQPSIPGYTEAGRRISNRAWIAMDGGPEDVLRLLLSSIYFRYKVLHPSLRSVAIGHAPSLSTGHIWVVEFSDPEPTRITDAALLYPADGEKDVPTAYLAEEEPRPIPDREKIGGVAVTALLITASSVRGAKAQLMDEAGQEVPSWLLAAEKPLIPGLAPTLVGLVPKDPLRPGTTYRARLSARVGGQPWSRSWSFTTTAKSSGPTQDELIAVALRSVNAIRRRTGLNPVALAPELSQGCLAHARYLVRNGNEPAVKGLGVHKEDSRLPGATAAGARAARGIIAQVPNPRAAVEGWVATPFHRFPLLNAELKRIGFAGVRDPRTRSWVVVLDTYNGK